MKKSLMTFAAALAFAAASCNNEKTSENSAVDQQNESRNMGSETSGISEELQTNLQEMLQEYLKLKDALVLSNGGNAQQAAHALLEVSRRIYPEMVPQEKQEFMLGKVTTITGLAEKIAQSPGLDDQRTHLQPLSEAIYALAKTYNISEKPLYYQHCPMANNNTGGSWLSATKEIRNPYFGDQMMSCGSIKETISH